MVEDGCYCRSIIDTCRLLYGHTCTPIVPLLTVLGRRYGRRQHVDGGVLLVKLYCWLCRAIATMYALEADIAIAMGSLVMGDENFDARLLIPT